MDSSSFGLLDIRRTILCQIKIEWERINIFGI